MCACVCVCVYLHWKPRSCVQDVVYTYHVTKLVQQDVQYYY
jgi:hypothetical protein